MRIKKITALILMLSLAAITFGSDIYPAPSGYSFGDLEDWAQPKIASGTASPAVASASEGDLFLNTTSNELLRLESAAWVSYGGGGGGGGTTDTATITAAISSNTNDIANHVASSTDPHGASMTVTVSMTIGSGTADTQIYRIGTGTIALASYTVILPNATTPSAEIATGTLWYDSNTSKLRCYDGSTWHDLW